MLNIPYIPWNNSATDSYTDSSVTKFKIGDKITITAIIERTVFTLLPELELGIKFSKSARKIITLDII